VKSDIKCYFAMTDHF